MKWIKKEPVRKTKEGIKRTRDSIVADKHENNLINQQIFTESLADFLAIRTLMEET